MILLMRAKSEFRTEQKILAGFILSFLLLVGVGILGYRIAKTAIQTAQWVTHSQEVLNRLERAWSDVLAAENAARGSLLTGDPQFVPRYQSALTDARESANRVRELTADNLSQQLLANRLGPALDQVSAAFASTIEHGTGRGPRELVPGDLQREEQAVAKARDLIAEMETEERRLLASRTQMTQQHATRMIAVILLTDGLAACFVIIAGVLIHLDFKARKRVQEDRDKFFSLSRDLNENLQLRASQLEAANKELEAFCYSVSHDLRAPLRHMTSFVHLLKTHPTMSPDQDSLLLLDNIARAARQMGRLVDDLLGFSKMARTEMTRQDIDLRALVLEVRRDLEPEAAGRKVEWRIGDLPAVTADQAMLKIVLTNLLSNALKYTRPRPLAKVEVGSSETEFEHIIFVADNGVGFEMKFANKLFGVFQRLHDGSEFEGTGIGLANVSRIILRHGGRVWAESEPEKGSRFYFSLPKKSLTPLNEIQATKPEQKPD
jgi:signal transduction histidine kinase